MLSDHGLIPDWRTSAGPSRSCPNCGNVIATERLLDAGPASLLRCTSCGAAFFDPPPRPDYAAAPPGGGAALAFYLQQGAGLWSIASCLLTLDLPGPRRLLEIGCGFGFGLDVARHALGWSVKGYDPGPFAAAGRKILELPILPDFYLPELEPNERYDVVLCSEVLEHVDDPRAFLGALRRGLLPGGVLTLTTPNAGAIAPTTPPGVLVPLLSVGYHTILQTRSSLERILREVGFTQVEVEDRGPSLFARASDIGAPWHAPNETDGRAFRGWLESRGGSVDHPDLRIGFLSRAYREAVAAGDRGSATRTAAPLRSAILSRYGIDLAEPLIPNPLPRSLDELVKAIPLSLGGVLLARGHERLLAGEARPGLRTVFEAAAASADALRAALGAIGVADADAEEVAWVARAEAVNCAAVAGDQEAPRILAALGEAPGDRTGERAAELRRAVFVSLTNAGRNAAALELSDVIGPTLFRAERGSTALTDGEANVLYAGAVLHANTEGGDVALGARLARALRAYAELRLSTTPGGSAETLLWPSVEVELLLLDRLGRAEEARLLRGGGITALTRLPHSPPLPASLRPSTP